MVYASPGSGLARVGKKQFGARFDKYKFRARAGKLKLLARVVKGKLGARTGKYNLGARANKYKLEARLRSGARDQGQSQGSNRGLGAEKYKDPSKRHSKCFNNHHC